MKRKGRVRLVAVLSAAAVLRLALPSPALASGFAAGSGVVAVPICGEAGHLLIIPVSTRSGAGRKPQGQTVPSSCCTICHSAMRKRSGGDSCCDEEDDDDVA